ncbi:MAG TPA: DNA helicase RecG, partial [Acidimicrobiales bacterium]|nr:DNA helicase RecG [Acidimicrobiales bacterium]
MPRTLPELQEIPVSRIKGVGPKNVDALADMGITSVLDLLTHYPRRWHDRTRQAAISELRVGEEAAVVATVRKASSRRNRRGQMMAELTVFDGTSYLRCTFFNQGWRVRQLPVGTEAIFFGKVDLYKGWRQMTNPLVDLVGDRTGRIIPIYPQSEKAGVETQDLAPWIAEAVRRSDVADPLPGPWREQ